MSDVTRILNAIEQGKARAEELLPLAYKELRQLAAQKLSQEKPGQTLQPTALVHEAWLRLIRQEDRKWADRKHFVFAAAVAMRRILIENARRKTRLKRGGLLERVEFQESVVSSPIKSEELLALDEALERFARLEPQAARLVELRYFAGLSHQKAAEVLGISRCVADGLWAYARAWLLAEMRREPGKTKLPGTGGTQGGRPYCPDRAFFRKFPVQTDAERRFKV